MTGKKTSVIHLLPREVAEELKAGTVRFGFQRTAQGVVGTFEPRWPAEPTFIVFAPADLKQHGIVFRERHPRECDLMSEGQPWLLKTTVGGSPEVVFHSLHSSTDSTQWPRIAVAVAEHLGASTWSTDLQEMLKLLPNCEDFRDKILTSAAMNSLLDAYCEFRQTEGGDILSLGLRDMPLRAVAVCGDPKCTCKRQP